MRPRFRSRRRRLRNRRWRPLLRCTFARRRCEIERCEWIVIRRRRGSATGVSTGAGARLCRAGFHDGRPGPGFRNAWRTGQDSRGLGGRRRDSSSRRRGASRRSHCGTCLRWRCGRRRPRRRRIRRAGEGIIIRTHGIIIVGNESGRRGFWRRRGNLCRRARRRSCRWRPIVLRQRRLILQTRRARTRSARGRAL